MQKEMNDMRGKVFEEGIVNYVGKKKKRKDLVWEIWDYNNVG